MTKKDQIIKAMESLPENATYEDAIDRLYVLYKVERGLAQEQAGETLPHEQVMRLVAEWFR